MTLRKDTYQIDVRANSRQAETSISRVHNSIGGLAGGLRGLVLPLVGGIGLASLFSSRLGDMVLASGHSTAGLFKLTNALEDLATTLFGAVFSLVGDQLGGIASAIEKIDMALRRAPKWVQDLVGFALIFGTLLLLISPLRNGFALLAKGIGLAARGLFRLARLGAGPFLIILTFLRAVRDGFKLWRAGIVSLSGAFEFGFKRIGNVILRTFPFLRLFGRFLGPIGAAIASITLFSFGLVRAWDDVVARFKTLAEPLGNLKESLGELGEALGEIGINVAPALEPIKELFGEIFALFEDFDKVLIEGAARVIIEFTDKIVEAIEGFLKAITFIVDSITFIVDQINRLSALLPGGNIPLPSPPSFPGGGFLSGALGLGGGGRGARAPSPIHPDVQSRSQQIIVNIDGHEIGRQYINSDDARGAIDGDIIF